jgi:hypothetical protein
MHPTSLAHARGPVQSPRRANTDFTAENAESAEKKSREDNKERNKDSKISIL